MNTKQQHSEYHHKSGFEAKENLDTLAAAGFALARTTLFSGLEIYDAEKTWIMQRIAFLCRDSNSAYDGYIDFCQQIPFYLEHYPQKKGVMTGQDPFEWVKYLSSSAINRQIQKDQTPVRPNWKTLAEAVLDITETYQQDMVDYWLNWFIARKAGLELRVFIRVIKFHLSITDQFGKLRPADMRPGD